MVAYVLNFDDSIPKVTCIQVMFNFEPLQYLGYLSFVVMLGETSILIKRFFFVFTSPPPLMYFCSLHLCANSVTNAIWTLTAAALSLLSFT